jgi:hypothetical protein
MSPSRDGAVHDRREHARRRCQCQSAGNPSPTTPGKERLSNRAMTRVVVPSFVDPPRGFCQIRLGQVQFTQHVCTEALRGDGALTSAKLLCCPTRRGAAKAALSVEDQ